MKLKAKTFKKISSVLNDYGMPATAEMDISLREENFEEGKLCDCIIITASWAKKPPTYDANQKEINCLAVVEVFADSENRQPRFSVTESRDLE